MYQVTERVITEQPTAVVRARLEVTEIPDWIGPAFAQVTAAIEAVGSFPAGPPFARYWQVPGTAAGFDVEAGFPVGRPLPAVPGAQVQPSRLPGGPAAVTLHLGPYEAMMPAYEALQKWVADRGGTPDGPAWECYWSEPTGDPQSWRTEVIQPYRTD